MTDFSINNDFTKLIGCKYPIVCAPMFLVSYEKLVIAASEAGALGSAPSLNWRTVDEFQKAVKTIKAGTNKPYAINLIVNKSVPRQHKDLEICAEEKVPVVITSLGSPKETIKLMHQVGGKVFCDVTNLEYAKKVEDLGADGVVAVAAGAGGHAGPTSPLVLIPYLKKHLSIPVLAAGGIATGEQMAATMILGASAAYIGTRFIASKEANVDTHYKNAILESQPHDIVMTEKISGTPAAVIKTPYIEKAGLRMNPVESYLMKHPKTKKYVKMFRAYVGSKMLEKAAGTTTWKEVWSAGQGVGLIDEVLSAEEIVNKLIKEYHTAWRNNIPPTTTNAKPMNTSA
mgnify:CR=1 FL=1